MLYLQNLQKLQAVQWNASRPAACAVGQDRTAPMLGLRDASDTTCSPRVSALCVLAGCNGSKRRSKTCTIVHSVFSHIG